MRTRTRKIKVGFSNGNRLGVYFRFSIALFTLRRDKLHRFYSTCERACVRARTRAYTECQKVHRKLPVSAYSSCCHLRLYLLPFLSVSFSRPYFIRIRSITLRFLPLLLAVPPHDSHSVSR